MQVKSTSWSDWRGINANDEISSLVVLGPAGAKVVCDNETNSNSDEGEFTVTIGPAGYVSAQNLEIDIADKLIVSEPAGAITVAPMPSGHTSTPTFNDELSSVSLKRP